MKVLCACPPQPKLVRHLMSTPVHTVDHTTTLEQTDQDFINLNISGAPVLKRGEIVGIISKRDISDARRNERHHLPVSSCMTQGVKTTVPNTPLVRAMELMVAEDIGRLPVLNEGHIIGIVTRSDVMRVIYPDETTGNTGLFDQVYKPAKKPV